MPWVRHATPEVDAISHYPAIISVCIVSTFFMLVVVIARLHLRKDRLGHDDWVIVATMLFSVGYNVMAIVQTRWGLGLPVALRPTVDSYTSKVLSYSGKPFYTVALPGYKIALCIGYLRWIEGTSKKSFRKIIVSVAVATVAIHLTFTLMNFLNCIPIKKSFNPTIKGTCLPFPPVQYFMAVMQILCDIVVFLLPIPIFLGLSLDRRAKIGMCLLFACGLITTVVSTVRAAYLRQVQNGNGDTTMVVTMGCVELNVGIIMSCLPFLRTIFRGVMRRPGHSYNSNKYGQGYKMGYIKTSDSNNKSVIEGAPVGPGLHTSDSQEVILHEHGDDLPVHGDKGTILKTTEFSTRIEDA